MSCAKTIKTSPVTVTATSTTAVFQPMSGWMPVTGIDALDFQFNVLSKSGNFQGKPGVQLATVRTDEPDAPAAITDGSYATGTGFTHYREPLIASAAAFYRVGLMYRSSSGDATAQVQMGVTRSQCGQTYAPRSITITPGMLDTTEQSYFPITDFIPLVGAEKVKAMFIVTDNESNYLKYRLVARSATDPNAPNARFPVETAWTGPTTPNTGRNTSEQDLPSDVGFDKTDNSLMQLGVAVLRTGGNQARATIMAMGAVRY
jgi:hypothetical protein